MSGLISALRRQAANRPAALALIDGTSALSYGDLLSRVEQVALALFPVPDLRCGLLLDNGIGWAVTDLATRLAAAVLIPIPLFFSEQQIAHVIAASGIDILITDQVGRLGHLGDDMIAERRDLTGMIGQPAAYLRIRRQAGDAAPPPLPGRTRKVTFTSGTTGTPKGVCLAEPATDRVAESLLRVSAASDADRHLCLLPLATLLENIAGIDVPILAGATSAVPSLREVGLSGSSGLDPAAMLVAIEKFAATTVVTVPQTLMGLLSAVARTGRRPEKLRLVAVGGAPLAAETLAQAEALGLPVFQGYGLSELSSVVAFNGPGANRPGSVGRPLPHAALRFAPDGEILVRGSVLEGYLGETAGDRTEASADGFWPTGDLGRLDPEGYLHLVGRKKNMFITSFGRNVAPEWVECELITHGAIAQAAVFGEARPWNAAIIVPRGADVPAARIEADIRQVNDRLPDYARVHRWLVATEAFSPVNGMMTPNGRLRRERIFEAYRQELKRFYEDEAADVS